MIFGISMCSVLFPLKVQVLKSWSSACGTIGRCWTLHNTEPNGVSFNSPLLLPSHELSDFDWPHALIMMAALSKATSHGLEPLKLWAKIKFSLYKLITSGICYSNRKLTNTGNWYQKVVSLPLLYGRAFRTGWQEKLEKLSRRRLKMPRML
jgi:hypothetical protein